MLTSAEKASGQSQRKDSVTITSIIQDKKARSPIEQKIDSRLLQAMRQVETKRQGATSEPYPVKTDSGGNIEVDITAEITDELLAQIKKLGGRVIFPSREYRAVRASVPLSSVKTIAGYHVVRFIQPAAIAQTNSQGGALKPGSGVPTEKINPDPQPAAGRKQNP